jgi:predicted ATP-grasp superfamily ATP-dependent carboligase
MSTRTTLPHAVVLGLDSLPGIQTARILSARGVPVIGIAADLGHAFCRTRCCERILPGDPTTGSMIDTLVALGSELEVKAVLVPCEDNSVLEVSRQRARLDELFEVSLPPAEVVDLLIDKVAFYEFAIGQRLPVAPTFILRCREQAIEAAQRLPYPAVLKPPHRTEAWVAYTPAKAVKVSSPEELLAQYDSAARHVDVLIAQKWIAGGDENLYSCNSYYDAANQARVSFTARKLRQWPPRTGISALGEECRNDEVVALTHQLFQSVPYQGLAYLEVKRDDDDGRYYIVEPNIGRPTGRSAIAEAGGVELVYTMYCDAAGLPLPANRTQHYKGVKWIYLRHDLQSAFYYWSQGELTLRDWWRSLQGPKAFAIFSWRDPLPFLLDCLHPLLRAFTRAGRKSRDYSTPPSGSEGGRPGSIPEQALLQQDLR